MTECAIPFLDVVQGLLLQLCLCHHVPGDDVSHHRRFHTVGAHLAQAFNGHGPVVVQGGCVAESVGVRLRVCVRILDRQRLCMRAPVYLVPVIRRCSNLSALKYPPSKHPLRDSPCRIPACVPESFLRNQSSRSGPLCSG